MLGVLRTIGTLFIIFLLAIHLLVILLFFIPTPKLLNLMIDGEGEFLIPNQIPEPIQDFLDEHEIIIEADYYPSDNLFHRSLMSILKFRETKFMNPSDKLAFNMNLLDFGEGIIGLRSAAEYYYKKPLEKLSNDEWIMLINLHKIFAE